MIVAVNFSSSDLKKDRYYQVIEYTDLDITDDNLTNLMIYLRGLSTLCVPADLAPGAELLSLASFTLGTITVTGIVIKSVEINFALHRATIKFIQPSNVEGYHDISSPYI